MQWVKAWCEARRTYHGYGVYFEAFSERSDAGFAVRFIHIWSDLNSLLNFSV